MSRVRSPGPVEMNQARRKNTRAPLRSHQLNTSHHPLNVTHLQRVQKHLHRSHLTVLETRRAKRFRLQVVVGTRQMKEIGIVLRRRIVTRGVTNTKKTRSQMNHQQVAMAVVNLPKWRAQKQLIPPANLLLVEQPIRVKKENLTRLHQADLRRDHHQKVVERETNQKVWLNRR